MSRISVTVALLLCVIPKSQTLETTHLFLGNGDFGRQYFSPNNMCIPQVVSPGGIGTKYTIVNNLSEPYGCRNCRGGCCDEDEDNSDQETCGSCSFCSKKNRRTNRRGNQNNANDIINDLDPTINDNPTTDAGASGTVGGTIQDDCSLVNQQKIRDLGTRLDKFKAAMQDDITLIFKRVNDRLDFQAQRIVGLNSKYTSLETTTGSIKKEIVDVQRQVQDLNTQVRNIPQIQNQVILSLGAQVQQNGLAIGQRWRITGNLQTKDLLFNDIVSGGYYRFPTTATAQDIQTGI